ncbi:FAD-dependent oxidoreductase [Paenibacillus flagellatus]|uniref:FAD-dependent oxidoreductase n=1 Tax=Paenibacillus flagellatus TaxID=2211139 RepID=A0A2V5K2J3_9BACL|nr:FAD-dependent oxidoreductase [Paenibacillus flagellatus]PYI53449.1 FAD-dependent oxidoreductase [Paenibacillus flagellatus]
MGVGSAPLEADVVVVGGGPAGICAALAAGRTGARTILIERYGFVGGMSTAALVYPWMTFHTAEGRQVIGGIAQEIVDRLMKLGASPGHLRDTVGFVHTVTPYEPETFKSLVPAMLREAGVRLIGHSFVDEAIMSGRRIEAVTLTGKSGRLRVRGNVFVDASGDGDLAYLSGTPCAEGREGDGRTQPMTMKFRMKGVDLQAVKRYMLDHPDEFYAKTPFAELERLPLTGVSGFYKHWTEADLPINRDQVLFFTGPGEDEVLVNTTRVQGLRGTDAEELTEAERLGREQVLQVAAFMKRCLPGFERASLSQVGTQIGVRETRRVEGLYALRGEDVVRGAAFEDAIARSGYPIDLHDPTGKGVTEAAVRGDGAYDIPYRCLLPTRTDNLLTAGRCISTTHEAMATTRLTPSCMATGHAAGTAAALAALARTEPHLLDAAVLQRKLAEQGAILRGER